MFRHRYLIGLLGLVIAFGLHGHRGKAQTQPPVTLTFAAVADTYVEATSPNTNFNTATELKTDASPLRTIYLRFNVTGLAGRTVQGAKLRLGVSTISDSGGTIHRVSTGTWNPSTVTWNNKPPVDTGLQTLGAVTLGQIAEFTLDGAITADGSYDFAIDTDSTKAVGYNSKEAASGQKPELLLSVAAGGSPTVTITQPTNGATFSPSDMVTLHATAADPQQGDLSAQIHWTSSLQGPLGTGTTITHTLGTGTHTITASVTDGDNNTGSAQITVTVGTAAPAPEVPATLTFSPVADTYVEATSPNTNFNTDAELRTDASPLRIIYVRFAVAGVAGRIVQQARLRLGVSTVSDSGGTIHRITNGTWNESTVNWNTKPAVDGPGLQTLDAVTLGQVVEFNLDATVTGDGSYDFAIDTASTKAVGYNSMAATSGQKPQLILTVASSQTPSVTITQPANGSA